MSDLELLRNLASKKMFRYFLLFYLAKPPSVYLSARLLPFRELNPARHHHPQRKPVF